MTNETPDPPEESNNGPGLTPEQFNRFKEALARSLTPLEELTRSFAAQMSSIVNYAVALEPIRTRINQTIVDAVSKVDWQALLPDFSAMPKIDFTPLLEAAKSVQRLMPRNWPGLTDVAAEGLIDLAWDGYPTAWVPNAKTLSALVGATPERRAALLVEHGAAIMSDCRDCLTEARTGAYSELVDFALQAVAAFEQSLYAPAQSLAASVLDTACRTTIEEWPGYKRWLKQAVSAEDFTLIELRFRVTLAPIAPAFQEFWESKGDPVPEMYNRHATAHSVGSTQYTAANAILSIMLIASLLRELHEQEREAHGGE